MTPRESSPPSSKLNPTHTQCSDRIITEPKPYKAFSPNSNSCRWEFQEFLESGTPARARLGHAVLPATTPPRAPKTNTQPSPPSISTEILPNLNHTKPFLQVQTHAVGNSWNSWNQQPRPALPNPSYPTPFFISSNFWHPLGSERP